MRVIQGLRRREHKPEDSDILIVIDAGYDETRLAFLLADLPVSYWAGSGGSRVLLAPTAPGTQHRRAPFQAGPESALADPTTQPEPNAITHTDTSRYRTARERGWNRLHPRVTHRERRISPGPAA